MARFEPLQIGGNIAPPDTLVYPSIVATQAPNSVDAFLLETLGDIDAKVLTDKRYELIRAAGLLRQCFLDEFPLVDRANQTHRCKYSFSVLDNRDELPIHPDVHCCTIDPSPFPNAKILNVSLRQFLALPVLRSGASIASVKDVIKACANAKGGVHYGSAANPSEELLLTWDESFRFSPNDASLALLAGICRVSLRGLQPIVDAILSVASPTIQRFHGEARSLLRRG